MKKQILYLMLGMALLSCGQSANQKIAHKWVVQKAYSILTNQIQNGDPQEKIDMANSLSDVMDSLYTGMVYDLKEDGTFEIIHKGKTIRGKWTLHDNQVDFIVVNGKADSWLFKNGVEIYGDSSIRVVAGNNSAMLTLKPTPGEKVDPDF